MVWVQTLSEYTPSQDELSLALATAQEYQRRITPIVSCRLAPNITQAFDYFLNLINAPENSTALNKWEVKNKKWKEMLLTGINSNTRTSLTITAYHATRIRELNNQVIDALDGFPIAFNEVMAGGDTTVLDAEYQAFILAARRTLDQLTYAISGFFKNKFSSFRDFGVYLSKQKKLDIYSAPLLKIYNTHEIHFHNWLLSRNEKQSIRDLLAHQKSISAGTLNVSSSGIFFSGMDAPSPEFEQQNISDVVLKLFQELSTCINDLIQQATKNLEHFLTTLVVTE